MDWDKTKEKTCKDLADKSGAFIWLYNETAEYYRKRGMIFAGIVVVGSYLLGASGIPTLFESQWVGSLYVNLSIQILMILVGGVGTIHQFLSYDKKVERCGWAASKYTTLFVDVKKELNKDSSERMTYTIFYEKINDADTEVKQAALSMPDKIVQKYYTKMGRNAIKYEHLFVEHLGDASASDMIDLTGYMT